MFLVINFLRHKQLYSSIKGKLLRSFVKQASQFTTNFKAKRNLETMGSILAKFVPYVVISTPEAQADEIDFHVSDSKSVWRLSAVAEVPEIFEAKNFPASTPRSQ